MKIRLITVFLMLIILVSLTSCIFQDEYEPVTKQEAEDLMSLIASEDKEGLKKHFSNELLKKDVDPMIDELFSNIDGNIVSYDEPKNIHYTGKDSDRGITLYYSTPEVANVKTSTDKTYYFVFQYTIINKKHPDEIGVNRVALCSVMTDGSGRAEKVIYEISTADYAVKFDSEPSDLEVATESDPQSEESSSMTDADSVENDVEDESSLKPNPREDILISIDPGHQSEKVDMSAQEPVAPSSSETKAKATGGTKGRFTGVPEYQLNLDISLKLRDALTELGYKVIMTREDNDTAISNKERAALANDSGADISIRIHANGSEDASTNGALAMIGSKTNPDVGFLYDDSYKLASLVLDEYCKSTGMASQGVVTTDTMTGINWSKVPVMILEMGFMTNQQDDTNMQDPEYQTKMVQGIVNGVEAYYDFDNSGLKKDIENKLSELEAGGAVCSVYIKNLKTDEIIDLTTEKHRAASIIKLFIAGTVYDNMNSLMQSGQSQPKLEGLIENMISKSDNDAANDLVRILGDSDAAKGMEKVNSYISSLGFTDSEMGRLMLDFDSGKENYISAIEVGEYLEMLYKGDVKGSDKILEYMKHQERVNKIPAGLPSDITVANKTGELEDVEHDSAIVYGEDTDYIIVILLSQLKDTSSGRQAAVDISSLVYDRFN